MIANVASRTADGLDNRRPHWVGAVTAAAPQIVLLVTLIAALFHVDNDERLNTGILYTGVSWLVILPVTTLIAVWFVLRPPRRDYGIGLLFGGTVAALAVAATSVLMGL